MKAMVLLPAAIGLWLLWTGCGRDEDAFSGSAGSGRAVCGDDPFPEGRAGCPPECTGGCTADHVCLIDCAGDGSCDGDTITCPVTYACKITCNGVDACDGGTVNCPPGYYCSLECGGGNDACGNLDMQCGDAPCYVDCGPDSCSGLIQHCGSGECGAECTGMPMPTVACGNACACFEC
jgi:hypothetical protein